MALEGVEVDPEGKQRIIDPLAEDWGSKSAESSENEPPDLADYEPDLPYLVPTEPSRLRKLWGVVTYIPKVLGSTAVKVVKSTAKGVANNLAPAAASLAPRPPEAVPVDEEPNRELRAASTTRVGAAFQSLQNQLSPERPAPKPVTYLRSVYEELDDWRLPSNQAEAKNNSYPTLTLNLE